MAIGIYTMLMESYTNMFAGFLHINFFVRIFLFIAFILFADIILEVLIIPVFLRTLGPLVVKGWSYAVTETIYEYIYIKYLSDTSKVPSDKISALYNKQLRKAEKNNEYIKNISDINEAGKTRGRRRLANKKITAKMGQIFEKLIIVLAVLFVISTFAYDFAYSKGIGINKPQVSSDVDANDANGDADNSQAEDGADTDAASESVDGDSQQHDNSNGDSAVKHYVLSDGTAAANIRSEPSFETSSIIEQVTNKAVLEYMGESVPFEDGSDDMWHKIKTESGTIGWISGRIVVEKE